VFWGPALLLARRREDCYDHVMERTEADLPPSVLQAVAALKRLLVAAFGRERIREVRLFGSLARGTARADSDADVLVVLSDPVTYAERRYVWGCAGELLDEHECVLDLLVFGETELASQRARETALATALDRDGVCL
jgi:predicted nucleotidyltransferase